MYKKKKKKKKADCQRKRTLFYLNFSLIAALKNKDNGFLSNFFLLDLIKSCSTFKNIPTLNCFWHYQICYWGIWKMETLIKVWCLVFGVWFLVELLLLVELSHVILLIFYWYFYWHFILKLGWHALALGQLDIIINIRPILMFCANWPLFCKTGQS